MIDWGVEKYGAKLSVNIGNASLAIGELVAVDLETDEQDNFVGLGLCWGSHQVFYYTELSENIKRFLETHALITQGGAFDIRMLRKWGVNVSYDNILYDTKILAYVYDSTMLSYGLKKLAKDHLGMTYPSYKELIGRGKNKKTLDQQPIEIVANYCGCDVLATYKLYKLFWGSFSEKQSKFFTKVEMPTYRLLSRMEDAGVFIDVDKLKRLDVELSHKLKRLEEQLQKYGDFNPRSPKQLLELFHKNGIKVKATDEKTISEISHPLISDLLEYRKYKKLKSTYTEPYVNSPDLPWIHTYYPQSTDTGRLASRNPNLQNVPVEKDEN